jgi:hypothetical protein
MGPTTFIVSASRTPLKTALQVSMQGRKGSPGSRAQRIPLASLPSRAQHVRIAAVLSSGVIPSAHPSRGRGKRGKRSRSGGPSAFTFEDFVLQPSRLARPYREQACRQATRPSIGPHMRVSLSACVGRVGWRVAPAREYGKVTGAWLRRFDAAGLACFLLFLS